MQLKGMNVLAVALTSTVLAAGCAQMNALMGKKSDSDATTATASSNTSNSTQAAPATQQTSDKATHSESAKGIYGNPPAGSPFSKLKVDMSSKEVLDLIGPPTDQKSYMTGKAWIPFYYGSDRYRMEYRYKHQGVITFAGGSGFSGAFTVYRVIYDPQESGYVH